MRAASAVAALALAGGCNELPPITYQTEHLEIGTDFDGPICAGTLHEFEQQVHFTEQTLDFRVQGKLEIYLFKDNVDEWCGESVPGCYSHETKQAYSTLSAARHEIIHATTSQIHSAGSAFFDEGFAVDLTGDGLIFPSTYPTSNLGIPPFHVSHRTAGHFMRWLRSRYTASELKNTWRHSKQDQNDTHAKSAFTKATGDDFEEVEQLYLETAPEFFAPFDIVTPPTIPPESNGWDIILEFDCERIETEGKCWPRSSARPVN